MIFQEYKIMIWKYRIAINQNQEITGVQINDVQVDLSPPFIPADRLNSTVTAETPPRKIVNRNETT